MSKTLVAMVAVGVAAIMVPVLVLAQPSETVVVRVIDGDTLVARTAGQETTVRLLNVDTPETKDPNGPVECLGAEATEFLTKRLPQGTKIQLAFDQQRTDQYGRTLAAVTESGSLVNAEIAAKGLGVAVVYTPNTKYYNEVRRAQDHAMREGLGLYDGRVACTLPAQVSQVAKQAQSLPTVAPADSASALSGVAAAATALAAAETLEETLDAVAAGRHVIHAAAYALSLHNYRGAVSAAKGTAIQRKQWYEAQHEMLRAKEAAAAEQARAAEAARVAEEARMREEARIAEEARVAEEKRRAEEATRQPVPVPAKPRATTPTAAPKTTVGSNPYPGYTGPRCYAPGGKTWKPC